MPATYTARALEPHLRRLSEQFPVIIVTGARQVGKTTLLRHLAGKTRTYVTLDDPPVLELARSDPALFLQRFRPPLLIDEVQYAPQLLPYIKMAADEGHEPGAFWLTGSQSFHLMKGVSESLAGRAAVVQLLGLSTRERSGSPVAGPFVPTPDEVLRRATATSALSLQDVYRTIWRGSLPAIALDEGVDRDAFYGSYVATYLQRDVRDLAHVGDQVAFLRFVRAAAARTGTLVNVAEMARDADVAPNTAKSWLSILVASGLVFLLEPFHTNVTKRLVKAPKLYFFETGLAAYLTEWSSPAVLEAGAMAGAILETWVVAEVVKSYWNAGLRAPVYFLRDKDQAEIDLLIVRDGVVHPVEIKKTASPRKDDVRHFAALGRLGVTAGPGTLLCLGARALPLTASTWAVPAWAV